MILEAPQEAMRRSENWGGGGQEGMVDIAQSLIASGSFSNDDDKRSKSKHLAFKETSQRLALSSTLCGKQEGTFTQSVAWLLF